MQWFSTFLMLRTFNAVSHVVVTPPQPYNWAHCYFITVVLLVLWTIMWISMFSDGLRWPHERAIWVPKDRDPQIENHWISKMMYELAMERRTICQRSQVLLPLFFLLSIFFVYIPSDHLPLFTVIVYWEDASLN